VMYFQANQKLAQGVKYKNTMSSFLFEVGMLTCDLHIEICWSIKIHNKLFYKGKVIGSWNHCLQ